MKSIKELYQYTNLPIAVLGGGPSLPKDLEQISSDHLLISVNYHALYLRDCDYMVFMDNPYKTKQQWGTWHPQIIAIEKGFKRGINVSPLDDYTNWNIKGSKAWIAGNSGFLGCWLACYISSGPVYLCGMNCNTKGERLHFHSSGEINFDRIGNPYKWLDAFFNCENPDRIIPVSGPLVKVFKEWQIKQLLGS